MLAGLAHDLISTRNLAAGRHPKDQNEVENPEREAGYWLSLRA